MLREKGGPNDNEHLSNGDSNSKNTPVAETTEEPPITVRRSRKLRPNERRGRHASNPVAETTERKCAKCGADLEGHGCVEKNGLFYCASVGCGYPPRKRASAGVES